MDVGENFGYSGDANADILEKTETEDKTDKSQVIQKLFSSFFTDPWAEYENKRGRRLQGSSAKKLYNPVICVQEGDAVFFNLQDGSYPIYYKDSILNTNPDFDSGEFDTLAEMITVQKIKVTTYSYVFQDLGIFVFNNNVSNALTIISVVGAG